MSGPEEIAAEKYRHRDRHILVPVEANAIDDGDDDDDDDDDDIRWEDFNHHQDDGSPDDFDEWLLQPQGDDDQ